MTRQNVTEGVREIMTRPCPTCDGDGVVLSEETIAIEVERKLRELASRAPRAVEAFLIQMNPRVSAQFTGHGARVLHQLEQETGKHFLFQGSEGLPLDHFTVVMEGSDDEVREEAIPFRAGDEVLVTIVEPHMYAVDDAVAKIDGYIVSVRGGGSHVGEKRLVRIEEAGRTSATAVLVGPRRRGRGRWGRGCPRIEASAPWPQGRTAPFRCHGRGDLPRRLTEPQTMYAIIKTGGKQYRVEQGQTLLVERLPDDAGATVQLEPVLFRSEDTVFDADGLGRVRVGAEVVEHVRGEKLRVFKFKPKRGYRRRTGHRQELTRIKITEIRNGA